MDLLFTVVIALRSIVEETLVLSECFAKDGDNIILLHVGSSNHRVGNSHVLGMVLVVVNAQGLISRPQYQQRNSNWESFLLC
jgi:hypothetical protein